MSHDCIRPCRYDSLLRFNFNGLGCEGVLLEHKKDEKESERNEHVSKEDDLERYRGPCKSMIECGYNKDCGEGKIQKKSYDVLIPDRKSTRLNSSHLGISY